MIQTLKLITLRTTFQILKFFSIFCIIIWAIVSCKKEPTNVYYVNLEKPAGNQEFDLGFTIKSNTIGYYWGNFLDLKRIQGNHKIISAKCIIDGNDWTFSNRNDTLFTNLYALQDGTHKLRLEIFFSSGSNSIADNMEMEGYKYATPELTLIKKNLMTVYEGSGILFHDNASISWKDYDGLNIKKYRILKLSNGQVFESKINSFTDSSYSGENGIYNISVVDMGNKTYSWAQCIMNGNLPVLKIGFVNNKLALTWKPSQFKDKIKEYKIYQAEYWEYSWDYLGTVSVNDSFFVLNNYKYGDQKKFNLYSVPKEYVKPDYQRFFYSIFNGSLSIPCPSFNEIKGLSCNTFYYTRWDGNIYKYTYLKNKSEILLADKNEWDISPNSKYLLRCADNQFEVFELNPFIKVLSKNYSALDNTFSWANFPSKISDNGICGLCYRNTSNALRLCIYDIINNRVIDTMSLSNVYQMKISYDGRYISLSDDSVFIYRIDQNSLNLSSSYKLIGNYIYYSYNFDFIQDVPDQFYLYEKPNLKIKSCIDFSTLRSIPLSGTFNCIDYCSHKILTTSSTYYNIYDYNTGGLIESIPQIWGEVDPGRIWLSNNTIFYPGYQFPISQ